MSDQNLKEVEIVTQRREDVSDGNDTQPKGTFNEDQRGLHLDTNKNSTSNTGNRSIRQEDQANTAPGHRKSGDQSAAGLPGQKEEEVDVFNQEEEKKERFPAIVAFLDHNYVQTFVTVVTVYALFGDDVRVIGFEKPADIVFDVLTGISLGVFVIELFLAAIAKGDYICGFFFWLDIISTASLVLDLQFVSNALFYSGVGASAAQLAKAGKASRVGTRAGRIVRLVRLIRIVKLYKQAQAENKEEEENMKKF